MKIQYLGTAAAEAFPAIFCHCDACRRARQLGGKNIRMRSGILLDDTAMIDFPPDIYALSLRFGLDLGSVRDLFVTHSHSDHFDVQELCMRGNGVYCHIDNDQAPPLNVYGNDGVQHMLELLLDADVTKDIRFTRTTFFQSYQAENGLLFTFLPCQHKADEDSGFYLVEKGGKRLVYAQDTGLFLEETLNFLAGKELDLLSLDCCFGKRSSVGWGHMGMPDNQQVVERLRENGAVTGRTRLIVNHFSHNCGQLHDELVEEAARYGFEVAYDGMIVEI